MVGILILTHGRMAEELLAAANNITGGMELSEALALDWADGLEAAETKVAAAVERLDAGSGVLILTDIFGGTPSNVAMRFLEPGAVDIVSGVNLPMVVRLGCLRATEMPLEELSAWIQEKGRSAICAGSSVPRPNRNGGRPARIDPCE
ncbi:MAG: PTS sugar transporter subunit IIA [Acidobacteriota bacterium]